MRHYELFLDESGDFTEGLSGRERKFASQIAGMIAPAGKVTGATAEAVLSEAFRATGETLPQVVHATEMKKGSKFDPLVQALTRAIATHQHWQPVRLENREGLGFGAIESTYTRMIAELCVRTLERLTRGSGDDVRLTIKAARYMVDQVQLAPEQYETSIREHFAYAAMRRGLASAPWELTKLELISGRTRREIQVCDLLSNASHRQYRTVEDETRAVLEASFGEYDFHLSFRELSRWVEGYLEEGSLGLALRTLAEELVGGGLSAAAEREATTQLTKVLDALLELPAAVRDPHLSVLSVWIEQLNEQLRDAARGLAAAEWALKHVDGSLRARLGEAARTLDGFTLSLLRQKVTAANHRGDLASARQASEALDALIPRMAGRWEHGPRIIESLVAQSVHLIDTFEHVRAATQMHAVAKYYGDLSSLLADALEGVFPAEVRSDQRGRALGTQLQAAMYAGLADPSRFDEARRLNEEAIAEFDAPSDVARQHQYRCQLETFAGDLRTARSFLANSLGVETTHAAIATQIANLPRVPQGFALLHWLRLGAAVLGGRDDEDRAAFASALSQSKVHTWPWCVDSGFVEYPAHGIRRQMALILARQKQNGDALSMLGRLRALAPDATAPVLMRLIVAASHIEVAGVLWAKDSKGARRLLEGGKTDGSAKAMVDSLLRGVEPYPALSALTAEWQRALGRVLEGGLDSSAVERLLVGCGRVIGY